MRLALVLLALTAPTALAAPPVTGDWWEYEGDASHQGIEATLTRRVSIDGTEILQWRGESVDALRTTTLEIVRGARPGESVQTISTTRVTEWSMAAEPGGTILAIETFQAGAETQTSRYEYEAPCVRSAPSPLAVGLSWSYSCKLHASRGAEAKDIVESANVTVVRAERLTVPAGTFDTFLVESTSASCSDTSCKDARWRSEEACRAVKSASIGAVGKPIVVELTKFHCTKDAPEAKKAPAPALALLLSTLAVAALARRVK